MMCLGEMTTWLPLSGAIGQLSARFVDESLGFAIGWNQWYNLSIGVCAEISAAVALIGYWNDTISVRKELFSICPHE
jgi:amino acid transporter